MYNVINFENKIDLNDWQSFCTSIDFKRNILFVAQNGKIIAERNFQLAHNELDRLRKLMPVAYIGSLSGMAADIQIYSKPLSEDDLMIWTSCEETSLVIIMSFC